MASKLTVRTQLFLKAKIQGLDDLASTKEALRQVASAASGSPDIHLFVDLRGEPTDLSLSEISDLVVSFHQTGLGAGGRKTAVLVDGDRFEKAEFFAVSAKGRGNSVQAFSSFEDACEWLTFES